MAAMERYGVAVHRGRLEEMIEESTAEAERLKAELAEEWGINPGSGKQLLERFGLEDREGWPQTKGGKPATDQESMKALVAENPGVEKWVRWRGREDQEHVRHVAPQVPHAGGPHPRPLRPVRHRHGPLQLQQAKPPEHPQTGAPGPTDARALLEWLGRPRAD
jgi:hypothetical protein